MNFFILSNTVGNKNIRKLILEVFLLFFRNEKKYERGGIGRRARFRF